MWTFVLVLSLIEAVAAGLLDLVSQKADGSRQLAIGSTAVATFIAYWALVALNWMVVYRGTPELTGTGWFWLVFWGVVVIVVVFGVANLLTARWALAAPLVGVGFVLFVIIGLVFWNQWPLKGDANAFANLASVTVDHNQADYPPTDDNHMVIVSQQNALYEANQAMGGNLPGSTTAIGSRYTLGNCALQSVDAHMYYICALQLHGTVNNRDVHYIVPGYIVVDAEDPNVPAQARLDYKMRWSYGGPFGSSLTRLIWNSYKSYYIDDLTLEVNDQWQPMYTATLDSPVVRWQ